MLSRDEFEEKMGVSVDSLPRLTNEEWLMRAAMVVVSDMAFSFHPDSEGWSAERRLEEYDATMTILLYTMSDELLGLATSEQMKEFVQEAVIETAIQQETSTIDEEFQKLFGEDQSDED